MKWRMSTRCDGDSWTRDIKNPPSPISIPTENAYIFMTRMAMIGSLLNTIPTIRRRETITYSPTSNITEISGRTLIYVKIFPFRRVRQGHYDDSRCPLTTREGVTARRTTIAYPRSADHTVRRFPEASVQRSVQIVVPENLSNNSC